MKTYFGLFIWTVVLLLNAAEDLKIAMDRDCEILPIGQSAGTLEHDGSSFSVKTEEKTAFLAEKVKHPVKPGGVATLEATAAGTGSFGLQVYFFDAESKRIGWMTSDQLTLKDEKTVAMKRDFRISSDYAGGKEIKFISGGLVVWKNSKIDFRDYKGSYEAESKNPTLTPAVSEHGGIIVRTKELTLLSRELKVKGERPILFIGDSITEGWRYPKDGKPYPGGLDVWNRDFAPLGAQNFGISAEKIEHILYRITECDQLQCNPKAIVLMIGTNNLGIGAKHGAPCTPEQIAQGIGNLLNIMKQKVPDVRILLVAVTPRGGPYPTARVNTLLPEVAKQDGAVFVDPIPVMTNGSGNSKDRSVFRDGLHFSPKGYELYASILLPELKKILEE